MTAACARTRGRGGKPLQDESGDPLGSWIRPQTWCLGAAEGPTRLPLQLLVEASTKVAGQAGLTYMGNAKRLRASPPGAQQANLITLPGWDGAQCGIHHAAPQCSFSGTK